MKYNEHGQILRQCAPVNGQVKGPSHLLQRHSASLVIILHVIVVVLCLFVVIFASF